MGLFDKISGLFKKTREPDSEVHKEYLECLNINSGDISRFEKYVEQYTDKLEELIKQGHKTDSPLYQSVYEEMNRFKYSLYEAQKTTKFIRENSADDIEYRDKLIVYFADKMKELLPESSVLRFHSTPIYFAEEILKSGGISSTADRFDGFMKSTDQAGEISVSDINSLSRTVSYFMDVTAYNRCLPCGCLFVLDSEGQTEEQFAASVMSAVDFKSEPDRLCAVLSTPENISNIKTWLVEAGFSSDLAYTFDGFISEIERERQKPLDGLAAPEDISSDSLDKKIKIASIQASFESSSVHSPIKMSVSEQIL